MPRNSLDFEDGSLLAIDPEIPKPELSGTGRGTDIVEYEAAFHGQA